MSFIPLDEAKEFLQVNYAGQDITIQTLIDGVEEFVEEFCGIKLISGVRCDTVDGGGISLWPRSRPIKSPITKLTQINDATDEEETSRK